MVNTFECLRLDLLFSITSQLIWLFLCDSTRKLNELADPQAAWIVYVFTDDRVLGENSVSEMYFPSHDG